MLTFALPNLTSLSTSPCVPWTFTASVPENVKGKAGKEARDKWINNPDTEHQVYSLIEGINGSMRVSKPKGPAEGNPPYRIHGLVGDYDAQIPIEELEAGFARLEGKTPQYFERTLSGQCRFLWAFESPIAVPSWDFAVEFLKLARKAIKAELLTVNLDVPAWDSPSRYYTNSGEWMKCSEYVVPSALVQGWLFEVCKKHQWKKEGNSIEIPLPVVWEELKKLYPAHGWENEFAIDTQGPSFWVEGSSSPKSAIVKSTGLYTFSANAAKPFWSWQDLLGASFCAEYKTKATGKAVENIYHDGSKYWVKDGLSCWRPYAKEDVVSYLNIIRGLSNERYRGAPSEVDEAMMFIRHWQPIDGAAPFVFQSYGIYTDGGPRFLNTHTRRVLTPAEGEASWGAGGQFPWLSVYYDYLFDPIEQKDHFLAWLRRFYESAYQLKLNRGQNVFLIGPAGTGKTLLSQNILTKLMSGSAEAQKYLLGETNFNSQLFETALWTVDDNSSTVTASSHSLFSSAIKKMASNQTFEYHAKFRVPTSVNWLGRVFVTANDDEESLRIIPDLEISALEKSSLFRTTKVPFNFPPTEELEVIIRRELPFFARWLLDWTPPEHTQGSNRYGVKAYHEPSLLQKAEHSSRSNAFSEILDDWAADWFKDHPTIEYWEGISFALLKELNSDDGRRASIKNLTTDTVARQLAALKSKGHPIEALTKGSMRVWRIYRPSLSVK